MKNNIGTIINKELKRFFGDKRLFFTVVLMPGLMLYIMYTLMGGLMANQFTTSEDYVYKIVVKNMPTSVETVLDQMSEEVKMEITEFTEDKETYQEKLRDSEIDLLMIFPENFDESVDSYEVSSGEVAPNVDMYYIGTEVDSLNAYQMMTGVLENYEGSISNKFDINMSGDEYDVNAEEDFTSKIYASMIPMLVLTFLFSGCQQVAPESISGEKERGTIATLLVTPMKRGELAIGKIISLAIITLLSGLSSFIGMMFSLPKMAMGEDLSFNLSATDYVWLLGIIITTVLVMISLVSNISANAKSVKEANTTVGPLLIVIIIVGLSGMFGSGVATNPAMYCIPLYNSVQCMSAIFASSVNVTNMLIGIGSNIVYTIILVIVLKKMFESEKVMFS